VDKKIPFPDLPCSTGHALIQTLTRALRVT
jgi:hypothetical protein